MPRAVLAFALAACAAPPPDAEPAAVTVVCWNIHHGRGADGRVDLDRIAAVLRRCDADVIALQEVDVGVARSDGVDTPAELGRRLGMHALFGHNLDYQGGRYGNAVLTRLEVIDWHNHRFTMLRTGEQRGALRATLRAPCGPLTVVATHLDYRPDDAERMAHVDELRRLVADVDHPVLVAGDFNALPATRVHEAALAAFDDAWKGEDDGATYPAEQPRKRIDWILLGRRRPWTVREIAVVDDAGASDHRPLRAVLRPAR